MTLPSPLVAVLLASFDALQSAGRRLHSPGSSRETAIVVVALVAVAALWAGLYMWDRRRQPAVIASDGAGLFDELCRVHRLSKDDRTLLHRSARELPNMAIAFVDPAVLDRHAESAPAEAEACRRMRHRLFSVHRQDLGETDATGDH